MRCDVFNHHRKTLTVYTREEKLVHQIRVIDMGGASDNMKAYTTGLVEWRNFRFTLVDTKKVKTRTLRKVVRAHVTLLLDADSDTGPDTMEVWVENGKCIYTTTFGDAFFLKQTRQFDFNFSVPVTIEFRVFSKNTPRNSAGSFQATICVNGYFAQEHYVKHKVNG
jgi:hypothetical protein